MAGKVLHPNPLPPMEWTCLLLRLSARLLSKTCTPSKKSHFLGEHRLHSWTQLFNPSCWAGHLFSLHSLFDNRLFRFKSGFDYALVREASGLTAHWLTVIYSVQVVNLSRIASHPYFEEGTQPQPFQCCTRPSSHLLGLGQF